MKITQNLPTYIPLNGFFMIQNTIQSWNHNITPPTLFLFFLFFPTIQIFLHLTSESNEIRKYVDRSRSQIIMQNNKFKSRSQIIMQNNKFKFSTWVTIVHCKSGGRPTKSSNLVPINIGIAVCKMKIKKQ